MLLLLNSYINVHTGIVLPPETLYVSYNPQGVCTFTSIQDAIDMAPPNSEIRVVNTGGDYNENLVIDKNLTIKGGYSSCGLAQLDSRLENSYTQISGESLGEVIIVNGSSINFTILGFRLINGQSFDPFEGGGMTISVSHSNINIIETIISNNLGITGGGIFINPAA